jgi:hypothetical protein
MSEGMGSSSLYQEDLHPRHLQALFMGCRLNFAEAPVRNRSQSATGYLPWPLHIACKRARCVSAHRCVLPNAADALAEGPQAPLGQGAFVCVSVDARLHQAQSQGLWSDYRDPPGIDRPRQGPGCLIIWGLRLFGRELRGSAFMERQRPPSQIVIVVNDLPS